jgi:predicted ATPase
LWIKSIRIENYKSFEDSDWLDFDRHMNVIVGANHSGKSALLSVVGLKFQGIPHKSSKYRREEPVNPTSSAKFRFCVSGQDVRDATQINNWTLHIPIPPSWTGGASDKDVLNRFLGLPEIVASAQVSASVNSGSLWTPFEYPSTNLFQSRDAGSEPGDFMNVALQGDRREIHVSQIVRGPNDNFGVNLAHTIHPRIYFFDAQRVPQNSIRFGRSSQLLSNASNLAEVLNVLQANRTEFAEYVAQVSRVIPAIKWISVTPSSSQDQQVEIKIWNVPDTTKRDDLAIPLAECGTGVGQILSILYVVMKSKGNVIVIDEPNSFLHPRAAKALIGILKEDRLNQYVISTHSPEIIVSSDPDRFFSLKFSDEKTSITEVVGSDLASIRQVLDEIGSQLSDVFGAECVIWVEGPTEVQCFPLLLRAANRPPDTGLVIAPLRSTGDLEGRHGRIVADIYRNLSSARSLLPTTIAVSLDGDKRDMSDRGNLERAFGSVLHFLKRRCYENYLIHPDAICAVLNRTESFAATPIVSSKIADWVRAHGANPKYKSEKGEVLSSRWLDAVDAPRLLEDLFQEVSESREIYRKPLHSVEITRWLIENDREALAELMEYVVGLMPK